MRIAFFALLVALPTAAGCVDPDCKDEQITVPAGYTPQPDGTYSGNPCSVTDNGITDYSACCPVDYEYVALTSEGVLCEKACGLGSDEAVAATADAAFVTHALADAAQDAVEALNQAP